MQPKDKPDTKPPPVKKTYEQVFAQLVKNLCEAANKTLDRPILLPTQPTLKDLEEIFRRITWAQFRETYHYNFTAQTPSSQQSEGIRLKIFNRFYDLEDPNKPKVPPSGGGGTTAKTTTKTVTKTTTEVTQDPDPGFTPIPDDRQSLPTILADFKQRLTDLPEWVQVKAQDQGVGYLEMVFGSSTAPNTWTTNPLGPTYDRDLSEKYLDSVRLDSVFVKVYGSLEDTGVKAEVKAVYCMGVYYQVESAARIAQKNLWNLFYVQATQLLQPPPPKIDNPSKQQLEDVLIKYRDIVFLKDHDFPVDGTPPKLLEDLGRPGHLFIVQDDDFSLLPQQIEQFIFSNLHLPSWSTDAAKSDLKRQIESLLQGPPQDPGDGGWVSTKYDQTPGTPPDVDCPLLNIKGDFIHNISIASTRSDVKFRGLLFYAVFYTVPSTGDTLTKELISMVYQSARILVDPPAPELPSPTHDDIDDLLLLDALGHQFQKTYNFDYKGKDTTPGDKIGDELYFGKVGIDVPGNDDAAVGKIVDTIIGNVGFPAWEDVPALPESIRNGLTRDVRKCLAADVLPSNTWGVLKHNPEYTYKGDTILLASRSVLVYCNGSISVGGQTLKNNFVYFVGVFYEVENPWG